ncbi:MAG TPA: hypothetical protein VMH22_14380, partial [bacterium]|nr:hypothetical protein [bacterium]
MDIPATVTGIVEVDAYSSYGKADGFMQHGRFSGDHGFSWDYRAYLKFGLDSLPDTCVLLSAKLEYFQFDHNALPSVCIKLIRDPVPLSAAELYNEIVGARAITPFTEQPNGWVEWDLNSNALIDSCRKTGWASFGIDCNNFGGGDAWGYTDSLAPFLHIEYALPNETDIQALRAELGTNPAAVRGADTALLRLTNKGPYASGMFWAYASLGFARESTLVQPVAVGETVSVRIAMPAPLTQDTMTYYRLWTDYETDLRHSNDTAKLSCWAFPAGAYAAEGFDASGFPPNGWSLMSLDGGPHGWARRADSGLSHSGTGFASCTDESTGTSDDWLMSSPICPGGQYRDDSVGFFVRGTSRVAPDTLDVLAMSVSHLPVTLLSLDTWTTAYCRHSV